MRAKFHEARRLWTILCLAVKQFLRINGAQWAGAFAFDAFFSLFPLMILLVTIASSFVGRERAGTEVIAYMESYAPISGEAHRHIFDAITGVINARGRANVVASLLLIWVAIQGFSTLICATNLAWGAAAKNWWHLPLKSLALLCVTAGLVLLGMAALVLMRMPQGALFAVSDFHSWVYALGSFFVPLLVVFLSLSLFYRLAPRRSTRFAEVWAAALCATILMQAADSLFVVYLKDFARLNAVYGAFGGIMAFLLWIYLSGCILIFGACLCAAQAEESSATATPHA